MQVCFDELYLMNSETSCSRSAQLERCACEISTDHNSIGMCQIQAHLAGATSNLCDMSIAGNCSVDEAREFAALGARPQPTQAAAWWIVGERCSLVKPAHNFCSPLAREA
jgi:hypothetical protein